MLLRPVSSPTGRRRPVLLLAAIACSVAALPALARQVEERKPAPRELPATGDVKTPAPAPRAPDLRSSTPRTAPAVAPTWPAKDDARERARPGIRRTRLDRVRFDEPGDGVLWALGETYKAAFDGRSATFVPFFGSAAPRNFPVAFELESVRAGGEALDVEAAVTPARSGERVILDRGAVVELYDLDLAGMEQRFVFASLPRAGDLVVRIGVTTELVPAGTDAGIELENEHGLVRYGRATVLDDAGQSLGIETAWSDGGIELRVPAAFLAEARFPVTIDPFVRILLPDTTAEVDAQADIAFDETNAVYAITWERNFSATDGDVWIEEYDTSGNVVPGSRQTVDFTGTDWRHPRVASNRIAGQFLVVAQAGITPSRIIRGRTVESETPFTTGAQFTISGFESGDKFDPDVGGDPHFLAPTYYCVVWTRWLSTADQDVHARLVVPNSTLLNLSTILIDNSSVTRDIHPSVSKSDGPPPALQQDWNIVWERRVGGGAGQGDIYGAQLHWDGVFTTGSFPISTFGVSDEYPSASSGMNYAGGRHYLVAFTRDYVTDRNIIYHVMLGVGSVLADQDLSFQEFDYNTQDQREVQCDASDEFFHVAYSEQYQAGTPDYDIFTTKLYFNGAATEIIEEHLALPPVTGRQSNPQVATRQSGGGTGSNGLGFAYMDDQNGGNIVGALISERPGAPVVVQCPGDNMATVACPCAAGGRLHGCPNSIFAGGANLTTSGIARVSADTFMLLGTSMPNSSVTYFQGTDTIPAFVIDDGIMCTGGSVIRLGTKLNAGNASQYPVAGDPLISVRGAIPAVAGVHRTYQAFYRNAAAFCTPATSNRTNGLRVFWLP